MENRDYYWVRRFLDDRKSVASYPFLPLIHRKIKNYKYKLKEDQKKHKTLKVRDILYASHLDSMIYAYYACKLQNQYESFIEANNLNDAICAYRKIKGPDDKGKCNIHFAKEVFDFIEQKIEKGERVKAITFDIKGFFDNLDHKLIKDKWKQLTNVSELPSDSYAVYKNVTQYAYVEETDLFELFKNQIICQTKSGESVNRKVKKIKYLREKNATAFCKRDGIKQIKKKFLIKNNKDKDKGIPQGLPISAIIANVYMMDFDTKVMSKLSKVGGVYKRYSDDIIVVCPDENGDEIKKWIVDEIKKEKLEIEESKTNMFTFFKNEEGKKVCIDENNLHNRILEYLGFSFDGEKILLKNASIVKFYNKMTKCVHRGGFYACHTNNVILKGVIFESKLIKKFSYAGAKIHVLRKRSAKDHSKFVICHNGKSKQHRWGNYLTYVRKSSLIMEKEDIKKQLRRHTSKLKRLIKSIIN